MTFVLKEAANYRVQVSFRVQNEICSGLRYRQAVKRGVLTVDKTDEMPIVRRAIPAQLGGAIPPRTSLTGPTTTQVRARRRQDPHRHLPEARVETAPSGMLARGTYAAAVTFVDDDKEQHAAFAYEFSIKRGGSERAAGQPPCAYVCHVS